MGKFSTQYSLSLKFCCNTGEFCYTVDIHFKYSQSERRNEMVSFKPLSNSLAPDHLWQTKAKENGGRCITLIAWHPILAFLWLWTLRGTSLAGKQTVRLLHNQTTT
jgi:hypothetical protein